MTEPPKSRMSLLTFVTVSVATLAGWNIAVFVFAGFSSGDPVANDAASRPPILVALLLFPLPALAATLAFLFVARFESGRKVLAGLGVFLGALASTIVFSVLGLPGVVMASAVTGGFAVFARRLLDAPG